MIRDFTKRIQKRSPFCFTFSYDRMIVFVLTPPLPGEKELELMDLLESLGFREARVMDYTAKPEMKINLVSYEYHLIFDREKLVKEEREFIEQWEEDSSLFKRNTLRRYRIID